MKSNWDKYISLGYGQRKELDKNTVLFRQGELGQGFYYLAAGEAKISLLSNQGCERDIDYVMPGKLLGEHGFLNTPYFTTSVITSHSILYFFSKDDFNKLCIDFPEVASIFMDSLILKVRLLAETTTILNAPAEYRLAHFLYKQYKWKNEIKIKVSQNSLASFIGTSRVTIHKIISQWKQEGMLEHNKGWIHFLDINKLENYLNEIDVHCKS